MAKTLAQAAHPHGPLPNGEGGCFARAGNDGMCPGIKIAEWLNALDDDEKIYIHIQGVPITNGKVRSNWMNGANHVTHVRKEN